MTFVIVVVVLFLIDFYVYQPVKVLLRKKSEKFQKYAKRVYWIVPVIPIVALFIYRFIDDFNTARYVRYFIVGGFSINYIPKLFTVIFLLIHDVIGLTKWGIKKAVAKQEHKKETGSPITRGEFISKVALLSATAPLALMGFGIVKGAHDYRVRRRTIFLPNLPKAFDGIKIGQLSDIHTGSFFDKMAVQGGIDMFLGEKPDVIFFTGDLVNNATREVNEYIDIFSKMKAPLGVYSVTGNHDYGDYSRWPSQEAKDKNFQDMIEAHQQMGYRLLLDENVPLTVDGESIGIIGVENWGAGRFQKYGDLSKAYQGSEEYPVKILLSHDPSHWEAQVIPGYKDIDLTLSGHTHGFQFGVEIGDFQWSPSQYAYKQWADLYKKGEQYIYVNRGFGYIGFPGRVGMPPELTILELKKG